MAAKAEDPPAPAAPSDPAGEPPPRGTTAEVFDKLNEKCGSEGKERERGRGRGRGRDEELEEESREAKRRRTTRQLALEKPPPPGPSGRGSDGTGPEFSFSFDTRFSTPIETTPKFGSFNLSLDLGRFEIDDDAAAKKEEDEDREDREGKIVI